MRLNRSEVDAAFIRGYVTAIAEVSAHRDIASPTLLRRLLSPANITREAAMDAGADADVERLDEILGTMWQR